MLSNSRKYNHCWPEYRNGPPCGWWRLVGVCLCRPSLQSPAPSAESSRSQPPAAARIINNTLVPLSVLFHLRCAATCHGTKLGCKLHLLHWTPSICCTDYAFVLFTVISYASLPYLPTSNTSAFDLVSRNLHKLKLAFGLFTLNYEE